jgi:hypothetical protein
VATGVQNTLQVAKAKWFFEQCRRLVRDRLVRPEFAATQGDGRDPERRAIVSQRCFVTEPEHQIGDNDIDRSCRERQRSFHRIGADLHCMPAIGEDTGNKPADVLI